MKCSKGNLFLYIQCVEEMKELFCTVTTQHEVVGLKSCVEFACSPMLSFLFCPLYSFDGIKLTLL